MDTPPSNAEIDALWEARWVWLAENDERVAKAREKQLRDYPPEGDPLDVQAFDRAFDELVGVR